MTACPGSGPISSTINCSSSGLAQDYDRQVLRGDPAARSFSVCYLKGRELLAVEAVNHSKDYMAARKLIAERALLDPEKLADIGLPLKEAVWE